MNTPQLPLLVTEQILYYATARFKTNHRAYWKNNLRLLSVCSTWRLLARPKVYQSAFYIVGKTKNSTNIETIISNNCTTFVRNVLIDIDNVSILPIFLENFEKRFMFDKHRWGSVEQLGFSMHSQFILKERLFVDGYNEQSKVPYSRFTDTVMKNMPRLSSLSLNCYSPNDELFENIIMIDAYQHQLTRLRLSHSVMFDSGLYLSNLTYLNVTFNVEDAVLLPTVNPATLKTIILSNIPSHFSWIYFQQGDVLSSTINFKSLKKLHMTYSCQQPHNMPMEVEVDEELAHLTVHFPAISELAIKNGMGLPTENTSYVFPEHINRVNVENTLEGLQTLNAGDIKSINLVQINMKRTGFTSMDAFSSITHRFCTLEGSASKAIFTLDIKKHTLNLGPSGWPNLYKLYVTECSSDNFWEICRNCPRLKYFRVERLVVAQGDGGDVSDTVTIRKPDTFSIYMIETRDDPQCIETFVQAVLTNLVHLTRAELTGCHWMNLEGSLEIAHRGKPPKEGLPKQISINAWGEKQQPVAK